MSSAEVERFVADLKSNEDLRNELSGHASGVGSVVAFAKDKGYDISAEEASTYIRAQAGQELSDDHLDSIAGGKEQAAGYGAGGSNGGMQLVVVTMGSSTQTQSLVYSSGGVQGVVISITGVQTTITVSG